MQKIRARVKLSFLDFFKKNICNFGIRPPCLLLQRAMRGGGGRRGMLRISISSFSNGHRCNHHVRREKREGQGTLSTKRREKERKSQRKKMTKQENELRNDDEEEE